MNTANRDHSGQVQKILAGKAVRAAKESVTCIAREVASAICGRDAGLVNHPDHDDFVAAYEAAKQMMIR